MAELSSVNPATQNLRPHAGAAQDRDRYLRRLRHDARQRWRDGQRILVETLLVEQPGLVDDPEAVFHLLCGEFQARHELGEGPSVEEYRQRFPSHAPALEAEISKQHTLTKPDPSRPSRILADVPTLPGPEEIADETASASEVTPDIVAGYEILSELGRGGMGVVFRARHYSLHRVVALKMILSARFACAEELIRFRLEGETAARLQHPNIVQVYEVGTHAGQPYLALEFVEGGTLSHKLRESRLSIQQSARLVEVLARAVQVAHNHGIIHRDLKPANILLAPDCASDNDLPFGTPKITDFGLAKDLDRVGQLTETGRILGTPEYMSPEQAAGRGRDIGPHTDIYALGAILYELLAGRPPFQSDGTMNTVLQVITCEPAPVRRLQSRVPRDLETICAKCLEKEPSRRYGSAIELADDLRRYLEGKPIYARPVGLGEWMWKWARRRPVIAGLLASLVLVSILGFAGVTAALVYALEGWSRADEQTRAANLARVTTEAALTSAKDERQSAENARGQADLARRQAESNVAFSQLARASLEWRFNNLSASAALLDQIEPSRRGWHWQYLQRLHHGELLAVERTGIVEIRSVAYRPDGKQFAAAGGNPFQRTEAGHPGEVSIWDTESGKPIRILGGFRHVATRVAYSPDGKMIAASSLDGFVRVWDEGTGKLLVALKANAGELTNVAWHPDGKHLATAGQLAVIWELSSRKVVHRLNTGNGQAMGLTWHPDGKSLATSAGRVRLWRWPSGERIREMEHGAYGLEFSPDGGRLAVSGSPSLRVYSADGEKLLASFAGHEGQVNDVAFSPDSQRLASAGADSTVRIWDIDRSCEESVWRGHRARVQTVAFHPRDGRLLSGASQPGVVQMWDLTRRQESITLDDRSYTGWVEAIAFSRTGEDVLIARPQSGGIEIVDFVAARARDMRVVPLARKLHVPSARADFSPDGRYLASLAAVDANRASVWSVETGKEVGAFRHQREVMHLSNGESGLIASTGCGLQDNQWLTEFAVWERDTGKVRLTQQSTEARDSFIRLSPDGKMVARGVADLVRFSQRGGKTLLRPAPGRVEVWDVPADGQPAPTEPRLKLPVASQQMILGLAFDATGTRLAASTWDGRVFVWKLPSGEPLHARPLQGPGGLEGLAFSPDCRLLAGANRSEVTLWDVAEGLEVIKLRGAPPRHNDMAFSPRVAWSHDGSRLAASNWDNSVSVWEADDFSTPASKVLMLQAAKARLPRWHLDRAFDALDRRNLAAATFHANAAREFDPLADVLLVKRGGLYARLGQWDQAAKDFDAGLKTVAGPMVDTYRSLAVLRLWVKDTEGYDRACAALRREMAGPAEPLKAARIALVLSHRPENITADEADRLSEAIRSAPNAMRLFGAALAMFRTGQHDRAQRFLAQAQTHPARWLPFAAMHGMLLARIHHARGEAEQAAKLWRKADEAVRALRQPGGETLVPQGFEWWDWALVLLFHGETREKLGEPA